MYTLVSQAYYLKGDNRGTQRFVENYIKSQEKPKEAYLQLLMSACTKLDDSDCVTHTLERLVESYPKPEYWENLLNSLFQAKDQNDKSMLHLYRLALEVDVLKRPGDYTEMAQLAIEQGSPGEAERVLEKGFEKKVFVDARTQDKNKRLLASAKKAGGERSSRTRQGRQGCGCRWRGRQRCRRGARLPELSGLRQGGHRVVARTWQAGSAQRA